MKRGKQLSKLLTNAATALLFMFIANACSIDDDIRDAAVEVQLTTDATLGSILTDAQGRTLYYFANDATTANTCSGNCALVWPVFNIENLSAENLGPGLALSDFTTITTESGISQTTYKGRPLYYYAPTVNGQNIQEAPGQTLGENFGGIWFVAKPDYTIMLTNAQLVGLDGVNYTSTYTQGNERTLYFTDARGVTLYTFRNDRQNTNNFTAADFSNNGAIWAIYETSEIVVPSALNSSDFGSITVAGRSQLTYRGWPLYQFVQDEMTMGFTRGVSFPMPGGIWPVPVQNMPAAVAP